jgi:hypothetical protein
MGEETKMNPNFIRDPLRHVLSLAYHQATKGKGAERHAEDKPFIDQIWHSIRKSVGPGFTLGQALKKADEAQRMQKEAAIRELLGTIIYVSMEIIHLMNEETTNTKGE